MEVPVFNQARAKFCRYHGEGIEKRRRNGKIYRKGLRQSISRRDWTHTTLTQVRLSPANIRLSEVSKETAIRYLKELSDKYALGGRSLPMCLLIIQGQMKKSLSLMETMFCVDK